MKKILNLEICDIDGQAGEKLILDKLQTIGVNGDIQINHKSGNARVEIKESFSFSENDVISAINNLGYKTSLISVETLDGDVSGASSDTSLIV